MSKTIVRTVSTVTIFLATTTATLGLTSSPAYATTAMKPAPGAVTTQVGEWG
jgi:hypothetical protein